MIDWLIDWLIDWKDNLNFQETFNIPNKLILIIFV